MIVRPDSDMSRLSNLFDLTGKVVLLTGGTRGIGRAMTDQFAEAGASLVIASEDVDACKTVESDLTRRGLEVLGVACDVTRAEHLHNLVEVTNGRFGAIDILICNAGIAGAVGPMSEADDAAFDALLDANLRHPLRLSNLVAPQMANRGGGSIVLTSSIAGLRGNRSVGLYGLTKAALSQLARNLAVEWGPSNIRANALAPGLIATGWATAILTDPFAAERRLGMTPLRRIGEPWEVAAAALFLASPAASFITGHTLVVDGGTLISDGN
jgi:NAD(P)-dependent dehydrogenase (short-subunit alcohol dehydrogenase family)